MKRWGIRIFVFLLLGAIVNVAVACITSREDLSYLGGHHSFVGYPWTVAGAPLIISEQPTGRSDFRILWPGFAINTVFYAAILWGGWMLFAAPFALRRRLRIKRGLCAACGYDLRGSAGDSGACPECGAAVAARSAAG